MYNLRIIIKYLLLILIRLLSVFKNMYVLVILAGTHHTMYIPFLAFHIYFIALIF